MLFGISAGVTWALETIIIGIALGMAPFIEDKRAVFLAPFVSTFIHDGCSAIWACIYNTVRGQLPDVFKALKTKSGKFVMLAGVIGGPVGMTGYIMSINYMGASIGAVASAVFPAIGAVLAYIFLKEEMKWYRWVLLGITLLGVYGLSYSPEISINNFWLGITGALMCSFGWGIEAVILAKCFKDPSVKNEYALQIRQTTSALIYGVILLPVLKGWGFTVNLFKEIKNVNNVNFIGSYKLNIEVDIGKNALFAFVDCFSDFIVKRQIPAFVLVECLLVHKNVYIVPIKFGERFHCRKSLYKLPEYNNKLFLFIFIDKMTTIV